LPLRVSETVTSVELKGDPITNLPVKVCIEAREISAVLVHI
jgi:hypothetical protein